MTVIAFKISCQRGNFDVASDLIKRFDPERVLNWAYLQNNSRIMKLLVEEAKLDEKKHFNDCNHHEASHFCSGTLDQ